MTQTNPTDRSAAAAQQPPALNANFLNAIWNNLRNTSTGLVAQLEDDARKIAADFLAGVKDVQITPEEAEKIAWATQALMASAAGVLIAPDDTVKAQLVQIRLDALAVLNAIEAVKLHQGEALIKGQIARGFAYLTEFIQEGLVKGLVVAPLIV